MVWYPTSVDQAAKAMIKHKVDNAKKHIHSTTRNTQRNTTTPATTGGGTDGVSNAQTAPTRTRARGADQTRNCYCCDLRICFQLARSVILVQEHGEPTKHSSDLQEQVNLTYKQSLGLHMRPRPTQSLVLSRALHREHRPNRIAALCKPQRLEGVVVVPQRPI